MKWLLKIVYFFGFFFFYLYNLVKSNVVIAYDILTPKSRVNPAFIRVPLFLQSDTGLLLFSNLLSMTPGTLSIDIIENRKVLLVHVLYDKGEDEMQLEFQRLQKKINRIVK
jgi:multicomponent Na+:H+ antiporter subunit E